MSRGDEMELCTDDPSTGFFPLGMDSCYRDGVLVNGLLTRAVFEVVQNLFLQAVPEKSVQNTVDEYGAEAHAWPHSSP